MRFRRNEERIDGLAGDVRRQGEELRGEMRQHAEDLKRYMLMLTEMVRDDIRILAEAAHQSTRLDDHERRMRLLEER